MCLSASPYTHGHPCCAVACLFFDSLFLALFFSVSPTPCSSLPTSTCTLSWTSSSMWTTPRQLTIGTPPTEESGPLAEFTPLTGYEPKLLDDFHCSETTEIIFRDESSDKVVPSYLFDAELDDETIGKALSSPLFIEEREEPADRRQAYHSHEESLLPAQSFFAHPSTGRPVYELSSCQKRKSSREMENERIRILLERQKGQILADFRAEIQEHEFQADSDRRNHPGIEWNCRVSTKKIYRAHLKDERLRRDQLLLHEQLSEQNRDLREAQMKSLKGMEELKRLQELRVDEFFEKKIDRKSRHCLWTQARIQELQSEANCMNDSRDFKDTESVRSGLSHVPSQPALFLPFRDPGGMLSRNEKPPDIWDTHGISGNVFVNPPASSSSPYPQGFNPWISTVFPSARNSFDPSEGRFSNNYGADQQRLQISELHFDKFPTPTTFACWKVRFKNWSYVLVHNFPRKPCCGSKKWRWLVQWII